MELEEFYKQVGGNFEDVKRRLFNEEFIRKFVLKFKDDETFDNLIDAFNKVDYKEENLPKPSRNQQWYKINNDYILVDSDNNNIVNIRGM